MNANVSKTNTGKLLVAVLAMAMVVAGAVVVLSDNNEVNAEAPTTNPFDGMYSGDGASYKDGVFAVTGNTTITLTKDVGSPTTPYDMYITIAKDVTLTITGDYSVYITNIVSSNADAFAVQGLGTGATLALRGGADVHLTTSANATGITANNHVVNGASLDLAEDSSITLTQTGTTSKGVSYWNSNDSTITAVNSTIVLDNAGGVPAKLDLTNSDIIVRNAKTGTAYLNLDDGSSISGGSITVVGQANGFDMYVTQGTDGVSITDAEVSIGTGSLVIEQGAEITAAGTTIDVANLMIKTEDYRGQSVGISGSNSATITGGIINADLVKGDVDSGTNAKYTLNGVTLQTVNAPTEVEIASTTGIVVTGKLTAAGATVTSGTQIIVSSGATATLPSTATDVYVASGATVTVGGKTVAYNSEDVIEVDTAEELIAAASAEGVKISITGSIELNNNLVIGNGTEISTGDFAGSINLGTETHGYTITKNGTGYTNIWLNSDSSANQVLLQLNGAFEASVGSIDVTNAVLTGDNNKIIVRSGEVKISGSLNGTLSIEGDTSQWGTAGDVKVIFDDFTVSSGAKLILNDGFTKNNSTYRIEYQVGPGTAATQNTAADIANFYLYGAIVTPTDDDEVVISVDNYANFQAFSGASIQQTVTVESVDGATESTVNLGDSLETIRIGDDVVSSNTYSQMQTVLIIDTLNLRPNTTTTIMGQLVIEEGVTLTVMNGATLIIDSATAQMIVTGQIEIEVGGQVIVRNGDEVTVTGSITSDGTFEVNSTVNIENGGSVLIDDGEGSIIIVTKDLNVKAGGELTIRSDMEVSGINNEGTVVLNGANIIDREESQSTGSTINMAANGAVVDIRSFTADAGMSLAITDDGLVLEKDGNTVVHQVGDQNGAYPGTNVINFNNTTTFDGVGVRGVTITEVVTSERDADIDDIVYDYGMNVAGTITVVDDTTPVNNNEFDGAYTVSLQGVDMRVAEGETLNLGTKVTLDVAPGFTLNVAGNLNAVSTDSEITTSGTINVTGKIETVVQIDIVDNSNGAINAAYYEAEVSNAPHYYYTTLNTAVADGATEIEVMGTITVTESLDIPTGVTVRADGTAVILIGDEDSRDVVVTVADGASIRNFTAGGYIEVFGTLDFDNSRDNRSNRIVSDVSVENTPGISFTNIYTALDNAESGDTVTITRDTATDGAVVLNADVEVKEGVTLVIPNSRTVQVDLGVTLTVNGTVQMLGTITSEGGYDGFNPMNGTTEKDADEYSVIIVNGALMAMSQVPYDVDTANQTYGYYIAGAYYNVVNTTGNWWYVTPVEQAAAVSNDVANGKIIINGDNEAGDVTFTGDETTPVTVTVVDGATLAASSVTLNTATFEVEMGAGFTGSVATAVGSIDLTNVSYITIADTTDADDNQIMTFTGDLIKADADGADAEVTIASGNVTVNDFLYIFESVTVDDIDYVGIDSFAIASGATLTVSGTGSQLSAGELTVDGTLVATDGGNVTVYDTLTVRGTFTVAEADRENNIDAGSADIYILYVGITCDDDDTDSVYYFSDATAATVNAVDLGNFDRIVVSAESTISGQAIENVDSTEFYVEDALWITVYSDNMTYAFNGPNDTVNYAIQPGDLAESEFIAWNGADGKNVPAGTAIGYVNYEQVYAEINYDVYNVYVVVDNSIGSVAIDGQLLVQNQNGNGYALPNNMKLDAGQHTITYTLAAGYEGTPTLAANGANVTVSGMNFTLSGDYQASNGQTINNYLTLGGATYSGSTVVIDGGSSGGSDMGLTDYLLIVLVILIVIMAIIVALRLMRS